MRFAGMDPRAGRRKLPTGVPLACLLIIVPCVALIGLQIHQALGHGPELRKSREWVVHTYNVLGEAQALDNAVRDAERTERGYVLTGNTAYLDNHHRRVNEVPTLLARLS